MHLLSGAPAPAPDPVTANDDNDTPAVSALAALRADLGRIESELVELKSVVEKLRADLDRTS